MSISSPFWLLNGERIGEWGWEEGGKEVLPCGETCHHPMREAGGLEEMAPVEGREAARRGSHRRWFGGTVAERKEGFRWPLGGCGRKLESRGGGEATAGSSETL